MDQNDVSKKGMITPFEEKQVRGDSILRTFVFWL